MSVNAKDVIEVSWFPTYERQRDILWQQLINLNYNIFLIEKIETFPFDVFLPLYDNRIFWVFTKNALIEASLMGIWRIVVDADSSALTLRKFKNHIFQHMLDYSSKEQLKQALREVDFETRIVSLETKVRHARHNYLAHLNSDSHINPNPLVITQNAMNLSELKDILNVSRELFDVLCFSHRYELWLWGYLGKVRERNETDIDELLDAIARNNPKLNMPEKDPEVWEEMRSEMSEHEIIVLNTYRRKFGLSEI